MDVLNTTYDGAVAVDSLFPHPENPRKGDVAAIASSIEANGFYGAVVVQVSTRRILAGNHRWLGAKKNGATFLPVIWIDCDDDRARRILLADNRTNDVSGYNDESLAVLLTAIQAETGTLAGTGYDQAAVDELLTRIGEKEVAPAGKDPGAGGGSTHHNLLVKKWGTALGQTWHIPSSTVPGQVHVLVIGDSRKLEDVQRSLMGEQADMLWTDPPYGVSYVGKTADALTIDNDRKEDIPDLLAGAFNAAFECMRQGAPFYISSPAGPVYIIFGTHLLAAGFHYSQQLIWIKDKVVMGHSDYHYKHEPIFYGWKPRGEDDPKFGQRHDGKCAPGFGRTWLGDAKQTTLLEFPRPMASEDHPTMKPLELIKYCLQNSVMQGGRVLDTFLGSGSTMAACEQTGRLCSGVEIAPEYAAIILERMSTITGIAPVLLES